MIRIGLGRDLQPTAMRSPLEPYTHHCLCGCTRSLSEGVGRWHSILQQDNDSPTVKFNHILEAPCLPVVSIRPSTSQLISGSRLTRTPTSSILLVTSTMAHYKNPDDIFRRHSFYYSRGIICVTAVPPVTDASVLFDLLKTDEQRWASCHPCDVRVLSRHHRLNVLRSMQDSTNPAVSWMYDQLPVKQAEMTFVS